MMHNSAQNTSRRDSNGNGMNVRRASGVKGANGLIGDEKATNSRRTPHRYSAMAMSYPFQHLTTTSQRTTLLSQQPNVRHVSTLARMPDTHCPKRTWKEMPSFHRAAPPTPHSHGTKRKLHGKRGGIHLQPNPNSTAVASSCGNDEMVTNMTATPGYNDHEEIVSMASISSVGSSTSADVMGLRERGRTAGVVMYLIRHGESELNTDKVKIHGQENGAVLSQVGKRQARNLGYSMIKNAKFWGKPLMRCGLGQDGMVKHSGQAAIPFDAVWCSEAVRAKETARLAFDVLNVDVKFVGGDGGEYDSEGLCLRESYHAHDEWCMKRCYIYRDKETNDHHDPCWNGYEDLPASSCFTKDDKTNPIRESGLSCLSSASATATAIAATSIVLHPAPRGDADAQTSSTSSLMKAKSSTNLPPHQDSTPSTKAGTSNTSTQSLMAKFLHAAPFRPSLPLTNPENSPSLPVRHNSIPSPESPPVRGRSQSSVGCTSTHLSRTPTRRDETKTNRATLTRAASTNLTQVPDRSTPSPTSLARSPLPHISHQPEPPCPHEDQTQGTALNGVGGDQVWQTDVPGDDILDIISIGSVRPSETSGLSVVSTFPWDKNGAQAQTTSPCQAIRLQSNLPTSASMFSSQSDTSTPQLSSSQDLSCPASMSSQSLILAVDNQNDTPLASHGSSNIDIGSHIVAETDLTTSLTDSSSQMHRNSDVHVPPCSPPAPPKQLPSITLPPSTPPEEVNLPSNPTSQERPYQSSCLRNVQSPSSSPQHCGSTLAHNKSPSSINPTSHPFASTTTSHPRPQSSVTSEAPRYRAIVEIKTSFDFVEQHMGSFTGVAREEVQRFHPTACREEEEKMAWAPPNGESLFDVQHRAVTRLAPIISDLYARSVSRGKVMTLAVFAHSGVIKSILHSITGCKEEVARNARIDNCTVSKVTLLPRGWVVDLGNLRPEDRDSSPYQSQSHDGASPSDQAPRSTTTQLFPSQFVPTSRATFATTAPASSASVSYKSRGTPSLNPSTHDRQLPTPNTVTSTTRTDPIDHISTSDEGTHITRPPLPTSFTIDWVYVNGTWQGHVQPQTVIHGLDHPPASTTQSVSITYQLSSHPLAENLPSSLPRSGAPQTVSTGSISEQPTILSLPQLPRDTASPLANKTDQSIRVSDVTTPAISPSHPRSTELPTSSKPLRVACLGGLEEGNEHVILTPTNFAKTISDPLISIKESSRICCPSDGQLTTTSTVYISSPTPPPPSLNAATPPLFSNLNQPLGGPDALSTSAEPGQFFLLPEN